MRRAEEKFELQSVKECNNLAYMAKSVGKGGGVWEKNRIG